MTRFPSGLIAAGALSILATHCGSRRDAATTYSAADQPVARAGNQGALTPVVLPDLSAATPSVAQQLRDQFAALTKTIGDRAKPADLASAYGEMGKLSMAASYRDSAESSLLDAESLAPEDFRWPYLLGHLYRIEGATSKSAASFGRARMLQPDDEATLVWLGRAHLDEGRPDQAEPLFARAQSVQPKSAASAYGLGQVALARKDYAGAARRFEEVLAINPTASVVHYALAMAYRGLGRLDEASAHLRQKGDREVTLADPVMDGIAGLLRSGFALEHLGIEALNKRDVPAALSYFRQGLVLAPDDASLRHRLGTALALSGDVRGAVAEFQEVLRRSPTDASTHYTLGVLLAGNGRYGEAIGHFSAAAASNPAYVEARLQHADALRRSGRPLESLALYAQASVLDPRLADARLGYAMALAALNRYAEARDGVSAGMTQYPDRPAFAHAMIRLLAAAPDDRVRDGARAIALAEELLARESPNPDLGEAMAMAMAEAGRYDDAITWQRQAMTIAEQMGRADLSKRMVDNLALYEHRRACRKPWRDDDPAGFSGGAF